MTTGPRAGETLKVVSELVIGRQDGDLAIDDPKISRRHAIVCPIELGLEVEDLRSTNGTFVDGERIERPVRLRTGARIGVGGTVIEVKDLPLALDDTVVAPTRARMVAVEPAAPISGRPSAGGEIDDQPNHG